MTQEYRRPFFDSGAGGSGGSSGSGAGRTVAGGTKGEIVQKFVHVTNNETTIATLKDPHAGVDVYADANPLGNTIIPLFRIYAINGGSSRVLVGRGRIHNSFRGVASTTAAFAAARRKWVASARCAAESFEVTVQAEPTAVSTAATQDMPVAIVGWDAPPGDMPRAKPASIATTVDTVAPLVVAGASLELVSLYARNDAAAVRWLQLFDVPSTVAVVPGNRAKIDFELQPGESVSVDFDDFPEDFYQGLTALFSTTAQTYTQNLGDATESPVTFWVR